MRITIDTNILIDIENGNKECLELLSLQNNTVKLFISSATAYDSRKIPVVKNANSFIERVENAGLSNDSILKPILRVGMGLVGYSVVGGGEASELEENIFYILFPNGTYDYKDYCRDKNIIENIVDKNWKNKICDTQIIWGHIYYENDIFVTNNSSEFHKEYKKEQLIKLGAKNIMYPKETVKYLKSLKKGL